MTQEPHPYRHRVEILLRSEEKHLIELVSLQRDGNLCHVYPLSRTTDLVLFKTDRQEDLLVFLESVVDILKNDERVESAG